ncbi:MAG: inositol monophosphatase family protein [Gammaproteobacteria bacterium]|jgi:myo-inositol-1(or 4)-monophosphatase
MHHPIVNIAIDAARKAGDIIVRALERLDEVKILKKGKGVTTDVDLKAEQAIIYILQKSYPDYGFICEESGEIQGDSEFTWIIDPLDGTTNFVHGYPHFCVSIALKQGDNIEHGVIWDPIRQELFTATRGRGSQVNNRRMRVAQLRKLDGALINARERQIRPEISKIMGGVRRSGSAALDLAYVAAGRLDGCIDKNLKVWDVAAGSLLVQEAGGVVTEPPGQAHFLSSGCIIASNATLIAPLTQAISI